MEKKKRNTWWVSFLSTILILGAFAIAALILANIGVRVYQNVVLANDNNFELRTSLNYVATKVRQKDTIDSVKIIQKDGIDILVLGYDVDGNTNETLIYFNNGNLCEHIQEAGSEFELNYGFQMIEISSFSMELDEDGYLHLTAQNKAGESDELYLYLRAGR